MLGVLLGIGLAGAGVASILLFIRTLRHTMKLRDELRRMELRERVKRFNKYEAERERGVWG